uniref:Rhodanese domain-containing protein n=1 Tax=Glossina austeni TaxID=7395 RepID=A0A1A9UY24_GLOAU
MLILDIRNISDFNRVHLPHSINIPYVSLQFGDKSLDFLNVPQLQERLQGKIIICISNVHENAVKFSKFLVECGVPQVCVLHKGSREYLYFYFFFLSNSANQQQINSRRAAEKVLRLRNQVSRNTLHKYSCFMDNKSNMPNKCRSCLPSVEKANANAL